MRPPEAAQKAHFAVKHNVTRLPGWWFSVVVTLAIVGFVADQQLEVLTYKVLQVNVGLILWYCADRTMFKNALNLSESKADLYGGCRLIARAIVGLACIIGVTIGI